MPNPPKKRRSRQMFGALTGTMWRAGTEAAMQKLGMKRTGPSKAAEHLARTLDDMKGPAMKLGQMLSMAPDDTGLPPDWKDALTRLQGESTARPWAEIAPILDAEVGLDAFAHVDETAIHAASMGQVHRGTLPGGQPVAIKVRYPGLEDSVDGDVEQLGRLLRLANILPKDADYEDVLDTIRDSLRGELDFERERRYTQRFCDGLKGVDGVLAPDVVEACSSDSVITTHWIEGLTFSKWMQSDAADPQTEAGREARVLVGTRLLRAVLHELFGLQCVQTDPNPANFIVTPDLRVALLDFGAAHPLTNDLVHGYRQAITALYHGDYDAMCEASVHIGFLKADDTPEVVENFKALMQFISKPFSEHDYSWGADKGLAAKIRAAGTKFVFSTRMRPPPTDTVLLNRRLLGTQMLMEQLGATVPVRAMLEPHLL